MFDRFHQQGSLDLVSNEINGFLRHLLEAPNRLI